MMAEYCKNCKELQDRLDAQIAARRGMAEQLARLDRFTPDEAKAYLDRCIRYWRRDDRECAKYYVDAFQSARSSLLGELLPPDEHSEAFAEGRCDMGF